MGALLARQCWRGWLKKGELDCFLPPPLCHTALFSSFVGIGASVCGALVRYKHSVRVTQPRKAIR